MRCGEVEKNDCVKYMSLTYKLIKVCFQDATVYDNGDVDFLLEVDNWNDFSFYTTYHLHASKKLTQGVTTYLGSMHICKFGQKMMEGMLVKDLVNGYGNVFTQLPADFYTISFSIDLFKSVSLLLKTQEERAVFVKSLNFVFGKDDPRFKRIKKEECYKSTVVKRGASMDAFELKKAKQIMYSEEVFYDLERQNLKVFYQQSNEEINLKFSCPDGVKDIPGIPYGIVAFIGHNGCGKSSLLYQLAKLIYTSPNQRHHMKDIIKVTPSDVGTSRLLMFSYSAFDNFLFPGNTLSDYRLMAEGVQNRKGRFIYCGVRDVKSEMESLIDEQVQKEQKEDDVKDNLVKQLRVNNVKLKSVEELGQEFSKALEDVYSDADKCRQWECMIQRCKVRVPSLYQDICQFNSLKLAWEDDNYDGYLKLSTGVKFFLHIMSHVYAYSEDNSILLFDEPENHLHPPMLSFMMGEIQQSIRNTHSIMFVATHSPIILQDLFAKNIFVIRRDGDALTFRNPVTETYGENFGYINRLVFDLNSDICKYHNVFEYIYNKCKCKEIDKTEDVLQLFEKKLECMSLSSQMVSYISLLHEMNKDE